MRARRTTLTAEEVRRYYDRFGKKLDSQSFYENPALDALIGPAAFEEARSVFEFGCGTGRFALRLLREQLPASARYHGCDLSPVMVSIASDNLAAYSDRTEVYRSDGEIRIPVQDNSMDRVVSSYVLDLLSDEGIREFLNESYRVLEPGGRLCLTSLTCGTTIVSRIVSSLWMAVFHTCPSAVGGCRPILFDRYIDHDRWNTSHRSVVTPWGIPSEVIVLVSTKRSV